MRSSARFLTIFLAAVGVKASDPSFEKLAREFDYDRNALLDVREEHREEREGAIVIDLSYASPRGGRVPGFLVKPAGNGPFAGILFGHWMMPRSPMANRKEFLDEALLLARSGARLTLD